MRNSPRSRFRTASAWLLGAVACLGFIPAATAQRAAAPRPNIVFILLDNVGQEWFGCYGSEEACTPNIDRLAAGGVRIENCYTPPVCGPSRTFDEWIRQRHERVISAERLNGFRQPPPNNIPGNSGWCPDGSDH